MTRVLVAIALAAAALLQGCGREPVHTRVEPPTHSLPDNTPLKPGAVSNKAPAATATAPQAPASAVTAKLPSTGAEAAGETSVAPAEPAPAKPTAAAPAPSSPTASALPKVRDPGDRQGADLLAQRPLLLVPVVGIAPARLSDNFEQSRGTRKHEAIDILAPMGTPVVAVEDGRIAKLFTSKGGGLTIYHYDPTGKLAYYYAHLQRYAVGLREGQQVRRGDVIGYVGVTGNSDPGTPHLHFAVFRLGTPARWWEGEAINPYPVLSRAEPAQQVASR
jgi:peptidoglycan LD-endopeptidase LytH